MQNIRTFKRQYSSPYNGNKRHCRNFNDRSSDNITFLCIDASNIVLNKVPKFTFTPENYRNYDKDLIYSKDYWHEITVR